MSLQRFAEELWTLDGEPISFWAPPIPARFTYALRSIVVRLRDGSLLLDSPVQHSRARQAELDALGPVRHIVSPNKLHHLYLGEWAAAYPEARMYAPPGLARKRPDLDFAATLGERSEPAWRGELDQCLFRGSWFMEEVVFFHRASRTIILGDVIENHDPEVLGSCWQRRFARANRMLAPQGTTPVNFRLTITRRSRARASLATMRSWQPQRLVLLHGPCAFEGAMEFLDRGFAWLD
jgi:hypothetical protein